MRVRTVLAASTLLILTSSAQADMFRPSHSCSRPYKPFQFNSEWEISNFQSEVEDFQECIRDFVEEQEDAVRKHQDAAQEAIDEWNNFVKYELG